jgi:hypothetical protein
MFIFTKIRETIITTTTILLDQITFPSRNNQVAAHLDIFIQGFILAKKLALGGGGRYTVVAEQLSTGIKNRLQPHLVLCNH